MDINISHADYENKFQSSMQRKPHNDCLQLRRTISIQDKGKKLLERHAIAPSAARLCWAAARRKQTVCHNQLRNQRHRVRHGK